MAGEGFVALVLSWMDLALYKALQDPKIPKGDAVLLDLGLGLLTVAVTVLWFCAFLEILF